MSTSDAFAVVQGLLGARVLRRMAATAGGMAIDVTHRTPPGSGTLAVILPVLDEVARLEPCLTALCAQDDALVQIVVVDGGSTDGTQELVRRFAACDRRLRLVDASPVPRTWNGKAWGLACGLAASDPSATWIACLDADVRPGAHLISSLLAHAARAHLDAFSAAPLLELSGAPEAFVHPAFLATLVYRYGIPGHVAHAPAQVQANGQCFVARRALLVAAGAFAAARASRCEDYTVARALAAAGARVGFYEGARLASVRMYDGALACWRNWPRSLALRDTTTPLRSTAVAAIETVAVQGLPLALVIASLVLRRRTGTLFFRTNLALAIVRFAVLAGSRRAYARVGPAYWLSPLADLPAIAAVILAALNPRAVWRGRALVPEGRPV